MESTERWWFERFWWWSPLLFVCVVLGTALFIIWAIVAHPMRDYGEEARNIWLGECKKPFDECAVAWDNSRTLREIYTDKLEQVGGLETN